MKKTKVVLILFYVAVFVFLNIAVSATAAKPMNIVIVLDTSDRISDELHPGQIENDKEVIKEIVSVFIAKTNQRILVSDTLMYQDRLTIAIPDQPGVPRVPRLILRGLTISDSNGAGHRSLGGIREDLENRKQGLLETLDRLYAFVRSHEQTGSDIWEWFKYEAMGYFFESHQNILICISDGYLNFNHDIEDRRIPGTYMKIKELRDDPEWKAKIEGTEGLLSTGHDFGRYKIDFFMSEIDLKMDEHGVPYQRDFPILQYYWEYWLASMGIVSMEFGKVGYPIGLKVRNLIE